MTDIERFQDNPNVATYDITPHPAGGKHLTAQFETGWGVSVISHQYSYGGREGLYEIGILNSEGHIEYDNPVNSEGVVGWLTPKDVVAYMNVIASLPSKEREINAGEEVRHSSLEPAGEEVGTGGEEAQPEAG